MESSTGRYPHQAQDEKAALRVQVREMEERGELTL